MATPLQSEELIDAVDNIPELSALLNQKADERRQVLGIYGLGGNTDGDGDNMIRFLRGTSSVIKKLGKLTVVEVPPGATAADFDSTNGHLDKQQPVKEAFLKFLDPFMETNVLLSRAEVFIGRKIPKKVVEVVLLREAVTGTSPAGVQVFLPGTFKATKARVEGRGIPPDAFLSELLTWLRKAPEEIFAPSTNPGDVYNVIAGDLGSFTTSVNRKAAMGELLRCLGGFESSWRWNEGVDRTNRTSMSHIEGQETGIFQVSHDSVPLEKGGTTLRDCIVRYCGSNDVNAFIRTMKSNHEFAMEYCARLLRFSYQWDGPIKRGEINSSLNTDALKEFENLLS